jgi:hypothetical protein
VNVITNMVYVFKTNIKKNSPIVNMDFLLKVNQFWVLGNGYKYNAIYLHYV